MTDVGEELALGASCFLCTLPGVFQIAGIDPQSIFSTGTLDELPDLAADSAHHFQQFRVRLLDGLTKKFKHTQDLAPEEDGKSKGCMQTFLGRDRGPGKVWVMRHVFDPGGPGLRPDSAWEAHTRRKSVRVR